jgi:hypothetical protein
MDCITVESAQLCPSFRLELRAASRRSPPTVHMDAEAPMTTDARLVRESTLHVIADSAITINRL